MCVAPLDITLLLDYHALIIPSLHRDIHGCTPIRPIRLELPEEMRYKEDPIGEIMFIPVGYTVAQPVFEMPTASVARHSDCTIKKATVFHWGHFCNSIQR